jgi:hypothetical protein
MSQDKTIPVSVVAFRAEDYSPDGKNVIISLTTKYSIADRKFSVPIECFHDLILDLQRLNAAASATSIEAPIQPAVAPSPVGDQNRLSMKNKIVIGWLLFLLACLPVALVASFLLTNPSLLTPSGAVVRIQSVIGTNWIIYNGRSDVASKN